MTVEIQQSQIWVRLEVVLKVNGCCPSIGYYAKAPTNLTADFNASGVILEWKDTDNNCTSTDYNVTLNGTSTSELTYYNINKTTIFINSSELNLTETYIYSVRGWNGQQSNNSKPFTLGKNKSSITCIKST